MQRLKRSRQSGNLLFLTCNLMLLLGPTAWSQQALPQQERGQTQTSGARDDDPEQARIQAALNWSIPAGIAGPSSTDAYGSTFVWTADGRPEVILTIHRWFTRDAMREEHELNSLSRHAIYGERGDRLVWNPWKPGVESSPVPGAAVPGETAVARLGQMRTLAREFTASLNPGKGRVELRLLTQPLYRYESTDPELLDGALFAFVKATDPDLFLLIEARRQDDGYVWHYALARQNAMPIQVNHRGREIHLFRNCWDRVRTEIHDPYVAYTEPIAQERKTAK